MHPDVAALLTVQEDDLAIDDLEKRLRALAPRLDALAKEHERAMVAVAQADQALEAEERRLRDIHQRVAQHRQLQERNERMLATVTSEREASAATAQLDQAKRMMAEDERDIEALSRRIDTLRMAAEERRAAAAAVEAQREEARQAMGAETRMLEEQLAQARRDRAQKAASVPGGVLGPYDRIRAKRRVRAAYPLRGNSCANCDTVVPVQRQKGMAATGAMHVCEGCGMLLYAGE